MIWKTVYWDKPYNPASGDDVQGANDHEGVYDDDQVR